MQLHLLNWVVLAEYFQQAGLSNEIATPIWRKLLTHTAD
jgi:hypothetical protein